MTFLMLNYYDIDVNDTWNWNEQVNPLKNDVQMTKK